MLNPTSAALNSCTLVFDVDEQKYLFVSQGFNRIFETAGNVLPAGIDFAGSLLTDTEKERIGRLTNALAKGQKIEFSYQVKTHSGNVKHLTEVRSMAGDEISGHTVLLSSISQDAVIDTAQLHLSDKGARLSEQLLNSIIDSQTNFLMRCDINGNFTFVNRQFLETFGFTREEIIGKHFSITTVPEETQLCEEAFFSCIANPGRIIKLFHKKPDKLGHLHDTEWEFISIVDDKGIIFEIQGIGHDVTLQKRAQKEAMLIKTSLEALINNTQDQIWSVDSERRYIYMNQAYIKQITRLTGIEPQKGYYSYLHAGYSRQIIDTWNAYYQRALNGERYSVINESIDPQSSGQLFFEVSFNPIYTENNTIIGVGCFAHNITPRLKIEQELLGQNERLRNIASLSSHELRRPVASMMGLISLMDRENFYNPDNKPIIEHLLKVSTEIDDVIRLIVDNTFTGD